MNEGTFIVTHLESRKECAQRAERNKRSAHAIASDPSDHGGRERSQAIGQLWRVYRQQVDAGRCRGGTGIIPNARW